MNPSTRAADIESILRRSRDASYMMAVLSTEQKNRALEGYAVLIEQNIGFLLEENRKDLARESAQATSSLYQRLKLDEAKLRQLVQGIRDIIRLPDPVGQVLSKTKLDEGLVLEKVSVPIGVIGIVFESRPDVIPQILSLALKSGNGIVLKGGKEAVYSNQAFMTLVKQLNQELPWLSDSWAQLLDSRQAVQEMLAYHQYVDLVIPRGSNQLVQSIMASTRIPVLGHADGICHIYVHSSADISKAIPIILDAKAQYPAACNALETLLVDAAIAETFLKPLFKAAMEANILLKGCEQTRQILPEIEPVEEADWETEYGNLTLAIKVVPGLEEAISHINRYGSHHTDCILAKDSSAIETFLNRVDSANVFANASTRFADGFRFGLGAEVGISTAKTHARGPVGLEGLVIYKYKLHGEGHVVADYVGSNPRPFLHQKLSD